MQTPEHAAGRSLVPLLRDVTASHDYPVFTAYQDHISVRTDRHRLIRYADGTMELYDCGRDPNEWTNLLARRSLGKGGAQNQEYESVSKSLASALPAFKMLPFVRGKHKGKR